MKKHFLLIFSACMMLFAFSACNKKEVKETKGVVKEINEVFMVLSNEGQEDLRIEMTPEVKFSHGAVMANDSVLVIYVASSKENQAAVIQLIPRIGEEIVVGHDDSKPLETSDPKERVDSVQ
jgi:hypothetical protein